MDNLSFINNDLKLAIVTDRINQLARDAYQVDLNRRFAIDQGNEEALDKYTTALNALLLSIEFHNKELASLQEG